MDERLTCLAFKVAFSLSHANMFSSQLISHHCSLMHLQTSKVPFWHPWLPLSGSSWCTKPQMWCGTEARLKQDVDSWVKIVCLATPRLLFCFFAFEIFTEQSVIFQCPFSTPGEYMNVNMTVGFCAALQNGDFGEHVCVWVHFCVCWKERKSEESDEDDELQSVLKPGLGCVDLAIYLATMRTGLCLWCDNTGPMHKTGLVALKSSLISLMRLVSKDCGNWSEETQVRQWDLHL